MPRTRQELERAFELYVADVSSGAVTAGRLELLAVQRHLRDLEHGAARDLRFDFGKGIDKAGWIEWRLKFSKKRWGGKPFVLSGWELFVVVSVFGWFRCSGGAWVRRFRTAYVSVAKKNGKSELAAAVGLLFMLPALCGEQGGEVYTAATKRDQAALIWTAAARMTRSSPELKREIDVHESRYNLSHRESGSKFEALASDADTLDGLGPVCALIDEYHEHPDSSVLDNLESGMGASQEPLVFVTTTAGGARRGPCWDLESDAVKILEGLGEHEGLGDDVFAFIARLDDKDDPFNESVWRKANPNLGISVDLDGLRISARAAKRMPRALGEFLRKRMNLWTEESLSWLAMPEWDACSGAVDVEALRGRRCWVGLDLSSTSDYTAGVAFFEPDSEDVSDVLPLFWIPEEKLIKRSETERMPVVEWVKSGLVIATPGNVVDQDAVKGWLLNLRERYDVAEVPMDPHNATKLQTELQGLGFNVVSMRQGWVTMSPAIKHTETLIRQRRIRHGGNPALRWMFSNVAVQRDSNDNLSLHKGRSPDRIDGMVALCMAAGRAAAASQIEVPQIFAMEA